MIQENKRPLFTLLFCLLLSGCNGPFSDYDKYELSQEFNKCDFSKLTAAGAQRCLNIQKECDKRKEESGFRC